MGKSYLIHGLRLLLDHRVRIAPPTGVAAFNIEGHTLHSLFNLSVKGDFKELQGEQLHQSEAAVISRHGILRCSWLEESLLTSMYVRCFPIEPTNCLETARAYILEISVNNLL